MYHIVYQANRAVSICQSAGHERCQYSTRREAFDNVLKLEQRYRIDLTIEPGPCPHLEVNP